MHVFIEWDIVHLWEVCDGKKILFYIIDTQKYMLMSEILLRVRTDFVQKKIHKY